jgi:Flp pilus assembly protein TadD
MGELQAADLAFTEANILDPHNPLVWAYLALTQLASGHLSEAEMALKFAYKVP